MYTLLHLGKPHSYGEYKLDDVAISQSMLDARCQPGINFFTNRSVNNWNSLSGQICNASDVNFLKNALHNYFVIILPR